MLCCHSLTQVVLPLFQLKHRPQPAIYLTKKKISHLQLAFSFFLLNKASTFYFFVLKGYFNIF